MKVLILVNESPWSSSLGVTALRFARALSKSSIRIAAVYFREEGVYHALSGRMVDNGTPDLGAEWQSLARNGDFPLLVCSSAAQRRLDKAADGLFRETGLAEVLEILASSDRVVSF